MEHQQSADTLITLQERIRSFRHALLGLDERATRAAAKVENVDELQSRVSALQVSRKEAVVCRPLDRWREISFEGGMNAGSVLMCNLFFLRLGPAVRIVLQTPRDKRMNS